MLGNQSRINLLSRNLQSPLGDNTETHEDLVRQKSCVLDSLNCSIPSGMVKGRSIHQAGSVLAKLSTGIFTY